jgi:hypothetical protein
VDTTGTFYTTTGSGTVDFINAADNSVFSLVPEFKLKAGQSIRLYYTATFDNTVLGLAPGTNLHAEVIVSVSNAAADVPNSMQYIDVDDDDGPAGQGIGPGGGDDADWSQSAASRSVFLPTPANCKETVTLSDAQSSTNPVVTGTATLTSFTSFNSTGTLSIDGSTMSDGQTNTQNVSAAVDGGSNGGGSGRNFVFSEPVVNELSSCVSNCLITFPAGAPFAVKGGASRRASRAHP